MVRAGLGLRDYVHKNGFSSVIFGFSGGIDSAVCAALAADALGGDNVYGVSMPSEYSSGHSRTTRPTWRSGSGRTTGSSRSSDMVRVYVEQLHLTGLAEENIQARTRGMLLMALSNLDGHLVLATGNKTELAVGYSTIYGDAVGAFAPIKDVFKTHVWQLARWRNAEAAKRGETPPIPENSITKPPSAELRPGQVDTDSLPDYALLDDILDDYVEGDRGYATWSPPGSTGDDRPRGADGRQGRVQAAPVPAGHEDHVQGLRPGPAAADDQPVARARSGAPAAREGQERSDPVVCAHSRCRNPSGRNV